MIRIGITGSLASGKTTASKIISNGRGPLFSADLVVKKLYSQKKFRKLVAKKFNLKIDIHFIKKIKNIILEKKGTLKKLEKIIHPLVRKSMHNFSKINKSKKFAFFEIPLLVESKLIKYFDVIIFIKSKKSLRLKRYISKGGNSKLFNFLDRQQVKVNKKTKYCDYIVVNNSSLNVLKRNLLNIIKFYE
tara:strand:- start:359 stop:925 length:567 start_codon:yes stop_codon:yes gene_type:complete